ncbi:unnamed protein product [Symbiodinium necroappetens]|uniref:Uncharacterized protein n=1 Tax=Symbiodinium necroappetens TaxID=1628268 RepID=A0A812W2X5_9DINO|nr:unnamed protein product [Symbiodinium necroappetens]
MGSGRSAGGSSFDRLLLHCGSEHGAPGIRRSGGSHAVCVSEGGDPETDQDQVHLHIPLIGHPGWQLLCSHHNHVHGRPDLQLVRQAAEAWCVAGCECWHTPLGERPIQEHWSHGLGGVGGAQTYPVCRARADGCGVPAGDWSVIGGPRVSEASQSINIAYIYMYMRERAASRVYWRFYFIPLYSKKYIVYIIKM